MADFPLSPLTTISIKIVTVSCNDFLMHYVFFLSISTCRLPVQAKLPSLQLKVNSNYFLPVNTFSNFQTSKKQPEFVKTKSVLCPI